MEESIWQAPPSDNNKLSSTVWLYHGRKHFFETINNKKLWLQGSIEVSNDKIALKDSNGRKIVEYSLNELSSMKRRAPNLTFNFKDGKSISLSFLDPRAMGRNGTLRIWLKNKRMAEALTNIKPFEAYFARKGYL